jgi:hypothetical protein
MTPIAMPAMATTMIRKLARYNMMPLAVTD